MRSCKFCNGQLFTQYHFYKCHPCNTYFKFISDESNEIYSIHFTDSVLKENELLQNELIIFYDTNSSVLWLGNNWIDINYSPDLTPEQAREKIKILQTYL